MRRAEEGLMEANIDIEYYYRTKRKIKRITSRMAEIEAELDSYGVSSPRIMSKEEAKYQKGTRIHTDAPLLELISEKDELEAELKLAEVICAQIEAKMEELQLTMEEKKILILRYDYLCTYDQIADRMNYSRHSVQYKLDTILRRFHSI